MRINRLNDMEEYVLGKGTATLIDLAQQFNISINTVRRDLPDLLSRGTIKKVYGGVSASPIQNELMPLADRSVKNTDLKEVVAKLAASVVKDHMTIYLDSGTTIVKLVPYLAEKQNITIVTHSLLVLKEAAQYPNLTLLTLGGLYNTASSSFVGNTAMEQLSKFSFDIIFVSATWVDLAHGLTNVTYHEAELKRLLVKKGNCIALMADHTKFGMRGAFTFCNLSDIDLLLTDKIVQEDYREFITHHGIQLLCENDHAPATL